MPPKPAPTVTEDVDDLDDLLDDFDAPPAPAAAAPPSRPTPAPSGGDGAAEDDPTLDPAFAQQLEQAFAAMLSSLGAENMPDGNDEAAVFAQFDKLMRGELPAAVDATAPTPAPVAAAPAAASGGKGKAPAPAAAPSASADSFQDAIRATMEKLKESDRGVTEGIDAASNDPMAALLAALGGGNGELPDDAELDGVLQGFMDELMSKEMLEEPLRQLDAAYPAWLAANASTLPPDELARYRRQHEAVHGIVAIFSAPNYKPDDPVTSKRVVELMGMMEQAGAPPKELMGDLPEGMTWGSDGMPAINGAEQCTIS